MRFSQWQQIKWVLEKQSPLWRSFWQIQGRYNIKEVKLSMNFILQRKLLSFAAQIISASRFSLYHSCVDFVKWADEISKHTKSKLNVLVITTKPQHQKFDYQVLDPMLKRIELDCSGYSESRCSCCFFSILEEFQLPSCWNWWWKIYLDYDTVSSTGCWQQFSCQSTRKWNDDPTRDWTQNNLSLNTFIGTSW